jgi:hypothetical protein
MQSEEHGGAPNTSDLLGGKEAPGRAGVEVERMTDEERRVCGACRHWRAVPVGGSGRADAGFCRRYPPQLLYVGKPGERRPEAVWPRTLNEQWCGEFQPPREARR